MFYLLRRLSLCTQTHCQAKGQRTERASGVENARRSTHYPGSRAVSGRLEGSVLKSA
uniref:Uncharacterized protein n=1 Tax=Anopheles arabiensis TaxID=7173 RepID=A0A182IFB7_ANOAR